MDVFVLDDYLVRDSIIDTYFSCIWSERVSSVGDFELVVSNTSDMKNLLAIGKRLAINESKRVMVIETHETKVDDQGRVWTCLDSCRVGTPSCIGRRCP